MYQYFYHPSKSLTHLYYLLLTHNFGKHQNVAHLHSERVVILSRLNHLNHFDKDQLFLSADPTQGFLKRRQSWISSGIEVRGRTTKLEKAYRNSREILEFATHFYKQRQHSSEFQNDGVNLLSPAQIQNSKLSGFSPTLIPYG